MAYVSDNFVRPNGALGGNWSAVIPNNAESGPNTFQGGILINSDGYGPINPFGGDAAALYTGTTFGNDQWSVAVVKTVAAYTAVLSITAASQSGGNTTYTYTVSSGSVTNAIAGGALYVLISGMQNSVNNGTFTATTFGAGTFTVANPSGTNESGSSGTGDCPSDSGAGVMVRGSGTTAATLNGYFFHVGTNSFEGGGRRSYYELWKIINGVGTVLGESDDTGKALVLPSVNDVIAISAIGTTINAYYNGVEMYSVTDNSLASGVPGITSWSMNGTGEYLWSGWTTNSTAPGNNGSTYNGFQAGDSPVTAIQLSAETFLGGPVVTQLASDSFTYANGDLHAANANWAYEGSSTFQVSSDKVFSSHAGINLTYRSDLTPSNDQYSEVTAVVTGNASGQNCGPAVRVSSSATTCYAVQYANNTFTVFKEVAGTLTVLNSVASGFPVTGDVIRLYAVGTLLVVTKNGAFVMSATDNSIASGNVGLFGAGSATTNGYSSWDGGNVTSLSSSHFSGTVGQGYYSDTTNGVVPLQVDGSSYAAIWENSVSWPVDQYSEVICTASTFSGISLSGPGVRISTGADTGYYLGQGTGNALSIVRFSAGTATNLNSTTHVFVTGDKYRIEVQGSLILGFVNGVNVIQAVDTTIVSGKPGLICQSTGVPEGTNSNTYKNWVGGSLTSPSGQSISGNAGVAGAIISYTGTSSGSVSADSFGNYIISALVNGTYVLTPSLTGFVFNPASQTEVINGNNVTGVNFTASTPATNETIFPGQYGGFSLASAFRNPYQLDLLQVINVDGDIVWNLTAAGVANTNPANPSETALVARFFGSSFSQAFPNTSGLNLDIFQITTIGSRVVFHVNYLGVPSTP